METDMDSGEHGGKTFGDRFGMDFVVGFVKCRIDDVEASLGNVRLHFLHGFSRHQMVQNQQSLINFAVWTWVRQTRPKDYEKEEHGDCTQSFHQLALDYLHMCHILDTRAMVAERIN